MATAMPGGWTSGRRRIAPSRSWAEAGKPPAGDSEWLQVQLKVQRLQELQPVLVVVVAGSCHQAAPRACRRRWRASPSTKEERGTLAQGVEGGLWAMVWACFHE